MLKRKKTIFLFIGTLILLFAFISIIGSNITSSAFAVTSKTGVDVECGSFSDLFVVEIYDNNNNLITENDLQFDKEYTIKVYNKSNISCNYYLTTDETELNTFSNYVSITLTEDHSYNTELATTSSIRSGVRLSNTNKTIINVTNFKPNLEPMVYKMQISTSAVKMVAQNAPSRITDFDFDLKLKFVANTTK